MKLDIYNIICNPLYRARNVGLFEKTNIGDLDAKKWLDSYM